MYLVGASGKIQQQRVSIRGKVVDVCVLAGSLVLLVTFNSFFSSCCGLWNCDTPPPNAVTSKYFLYSLYYPRALKQGADLEDPAQPDSEADGRPWEGRGQ